MKLVPRGYEYPIQTVRIAPFPADLAELFPKPVGLVESEWPPLQLSYLSDYLRSLGCKTIVSESHYTDRDHIEDLSLFYARSLRPYPNYCHRLHFFSESFSQRRWRGWISGNAAVRETGKAVLEAAYLGYSVIKPLPGCPVGRTVIRFDDSRVQAGLKAELGTVREYPVHLAGFTLRVRGLAFQQQDTGVSACATTALWSALHCVAPREGLAVPTPATITESASRYFLAGGRALPSEGLSVYQVCEATRAAGLAPLLVRSTSLEQDRAHLLAYITSGFAPVLGIERLTDGSGHAVCGVGLDLGDPQPLTDVNLHHRDAASAVQRVYVHDDRLGPYAPADLLSYTVKGGIRTALRIVGWTNELWILTVLIVPIPIKVRLTLARMRELGRVIAEGLGATLTEFNGTVTLNCRYQLGTAYRETAFGFGLSDGGLYTLQCELVLSRYVGLIELSSRDGPLLDVILDATDTAANPAVLACVQRAAVDQRTTGTLRRLARILGGRFIA